MSVTTSIGGSSNKLNKNINTPKTRVLLPHEKVIEKYGLKLTPEDFLPKKKLGNLLRFEILVDFFNAEKELKNIKAFTSNKAQKTFNIHFFDQQNFLDFNNSYSTRLVDATIARIKKDEKDPAEFQIDYVLSFNDDPTDINCKLITVR